MKDMTKRLVMVGISRKGEKGFRKSYAVKEGNCLRYISTPPYTPTKITLNHNQDELNDNYQGAKK